MFVRRPTRRGLESIVHSSNAYWQQRGVPYSETACCTSCAGSLLAGPTEHSHQYRMCFAMAPLSSNGWSPKIRKLTNQRKPSTTTTLGMLWLRALGIPMETEWPANSKSASTWIPKRFNQYKYVKIACCKTNARPRQMLKWLNG